MCWLALSPCLSSSFGGVAGRLGSPCPSRRVRNPSLSLEVSPTFFLPFRDLLLDHCSLHNSDILDMPQSKFSLTWSKFGEKYGPLTWLAIPGQNVLVVNSLEAAKELLEQRGLNYIDRPRFVMGSELLGEHSM